MITILIQDKGLSITQAIAYIESEFLELLKIIEISKAEIKSYGPEVDAAVHSYVHGMEQWVYGNIVWSLEAGRYLSGENEEAKRTLVVKLQSPSSAK